MSTMPRIGNRNHLNALFYYNFYRSFTHAHQNRVMSLQKQFHYYPHHPLRLSVYHVYIYQRSVSAVISISISIHSRTNISKVNLSACYYYLLPINCNISKTTRGHSESADLRQGSSSVSTYFCYT